MTALQAILMSLIMAVGVSAQATAAPLQIVKDTGNTQPVASYLKGVELPTKRNINVSIQQAVQSNKLSNKQLISAKKLMLPTKNNFSYGAVKKHQLSVSHFEGTPIYIIGNDSQSIHWLQTNKHYLKKIHAIGIIAKASSIDEIKQIENNAGVFLTTANINGLSKLIGTNHYPVLIYRHWVLQ